MMANYDFNNISFHQFEILVRDLLNELYSSEFGTNNDIDPGKIITFNSYKAGKDKGIDLLYELSDARQCIVQIKQTSELKFDSFKRKLERKNGQRLSEIEKVKKLNPYRYIFVSNIPMSSGNEDTLVKIFSPFIKSRNDIYHKDKLNALLSKFADVERRHVNLYFDNPIILERIINSSLYFKSDYLKNRIKDKLDLYVKTRAYQEASEILDSQHVLIIKGLPGVGKTTLAELQALRFLDKGYEVYEIDDINNDVEKELSKIDKKLFIYDDFLGANYFDSQRMDSQESKLLRLIRVIAKSITSYLVCTTRTSILNKAEIDSEKFRRTSASLIKYELDIGVLTQNEKRVLIEKHVKKYSNEKPISLMLLNTPLFDFVVSHTNFSPRLVEYVSSYGIEENHDKNSFEKFVRNSFDNPNEIWAHLFEKQLSLLDRSLITCLFLFGGTTTIIALKNSFQKRLEFEVKNNNYTIKGTEFKEAFKALDGSMFVVTGSHFDLDTTFIEFINPSVSDYLNNYYKENLFELERGLLSISSVHQLNSIFSHERRDLLNIFGSYKDVEGFLLSKNILEIVDILEPVTISEYIRIASFYISSNSLSDSLSELIGLVEINRGELHYDVIEYILFLESVSGIKVVLKKIKENWSMIVLDLCENSSQLKEASFLIDYMREYDLIAHTLSKAQLRSSFENMCSRVIKEEFEQFLFMREESIRSYEDLEFLREDFSQEVGREFAILEEPKRIVDILFGDYDWSNLISYNLMKY